MLAIKITLFLIILTFISGFLTKIKFNSYTISKRIEYSFDTNKAPKDYQTMLVITGLLILSTIFSIVYSSFYILFVLI